MSELCAADAFDRLACPVDQCRMTSDNFALGREADRICRVAPAAREQLVEEGAIDAEKHRRRAVVEFSAKFRCRSPANPDLGSQNSAAGRHAQICPSE